MPAWGPVRLIAATPIAWSAIDTRVALWCSPVASRTSSSRGSGSSVIPAASASSSSVVSPIADTTTTRSLPFARSRAIRRATRLIRSAPATDDPPNFMTTSGLGMRGILPEGPLPTLRPECATIGLFPPLECLPMCFDQESRPPVPAIAGGALDARDVELDGRGRQPVRGVCRPGGGAHGCRDRDPPRRARAALPTSASWRCASRSTASTRSPSTTSAAPRASATATTASSTCRTSSRRPTRGCGPTSRPPRRTCARRRRSRACSRPASAWAAGRRSSPPGSGSGWPASSGSTAGRPAPRATTRPPRPTSPTRSRARSCRSSAAPTRASARPSATAWEQALTAAGVEHETIVYEGAPHSFFDRKAGDFADQSAAAWDATLGFIRAHTAVAP